MSACCLVVDDEPDVERLIKQRFRADIANGSLNFVFSCNGEDALEKLSAHGEVDIILTDINMPRMDGITLISKAREINPIARTVVVSAYGDMENIRASMNRGAFDFITKPINFDDLRATIRKTLDYVTQIREALTRSRENDILKMYVNPSFVNYLCRDIGDGQTLAMTDSRRFVGSVLFVDICGFTRLSEVLDLDEVTRLLNSYFEVFARCACQYGGTVDKFIGDAALLVFEGEDHLRRSVDASLDLLSSIEEKSNLEMKAGILHPPISIGINSGELLAGHFGSATLGRFDYTVIGDTVNTASRLQGLAHDGEVYMPWLLASTLDASYKVHRVGPLELKNKRTPLETARLVERSP